MYVYLHSDKTPPPFTRISLLTNPREPGSDVNSTTCCANTRYCVINETTLGVHCCDLGLDCGSSCGQESYFSPFPTKTTDTAASTVTTDRAGTCVARKCVSTMYMCPGSLGGGCCAFGQECASGGVCLQSETATTMAVCASGLRNCGRLLDAQGTRCCPSDAACMTTSLSVYYCPTSAACTSTLSSTHYCLGSTSALGATPTTTSTTAEASNENASGSIALKVGLGVGIPAGISSIAVIVFAWRIRRAKKQRTRDSKPAQQQEYRKPELAADSIPIPVELENPTPELSAQILEAELPQEGIVAEVPGGASQMPARLNFLTRNYQRAGQRRGRRATKPLRT